MAHEYIKKCQHLIKSSARFCKNFNSKLSLKQQIENQPQLQHYLDLQFRPKIRNKQKIGYRQIISYPQLRITIFHLPSNITMKLHNHPDMYVLTYILQGSMDALFFNPSSQNSSLFIKQFSVLSQGMKAYTQPHFNNLHEFTGKDKGCAFLDIIFPDYNQKDRPCSYFNYQYVEKINQKQMYELTQLDKDFTEPMVMV